MRKLPWSIEDNLSFHKASLICGLQQIHCTSVFASHLVPLPEPLKLAEVAIPILYSCTYTAAPVPVLSNRFETPNGEPQPGSSSGHWKGVLMIPSRWRSCCRRPMVGHSASERGQGYAHM